MTTYSRSFCYLLSFGGRNHVNFRCLTPIKLFCVDDSKRAPLWFSAMPLNFLEILSRSFVHCLQPWTFGFSFAFILQNLKTPTYYHHCKFVPIPFAIYFSSVIPYHLQFTSAYVRVRDFTFIYVDCIKYSFPMAQTSQSIFFYQFNTCLFVFRRIGHRNIIMYGTYGKMAKGKRKRKEVIPFCFYFWGRIFAAKTLLFFFPFFRLFRSCKTSWVKKGTSPLSTKSEIFFSYPDYNVFFLQLLLRKELHGCACGIRGWEVDEKVHFSIFLLLNIQMNIPSAVYIHVKKILNNVSESYQSHVSVSVSHISLNVNHGTVRTYST